MLPNVASNHFAMLHSSIVKNPLDEIVAVLVACNVDKWDAGAILAPLADSVEVAAKEFCASNLEALLDYLGGELVGAVLGRIPDNVINGAGAVGRAPVFADMLDTPVSKLSMSDNVDVGKYFFDARALGHLSVLRYYKHKERHTLSSSRQFSKMFCTTRLPVSPKATSCHMPRSASLTYFMICGGDSVQRSSKSFCQT